MSEVTPTETGLVRKGNVLFNNALNIFYLLVMWRPTYGKGTLSERRNPLLFLISRKGSFRYTIPQTVVKHWFERETAQLIYYGNTSRWSPYQDVKTVPYLAFKSIYLNTINAIYL